MEPFCLKGVDDLRLKFICCNVMTRMACLAVAHSVNTVDLQFMPLNLHVEPDKMREFLQKEIDVVDAGPEDYDAIILGFGLCGNGTAGLVSQRFKMVIPRAHDCCTLFMGSTDAFLKRFEDHLSAGWSSHGYSERYGEMSTATDGCTPYGSEMGFDKMVESYGEENARYLWDMLHPVHLEEPHIYIKVDPFENLGLFEKYQQRIAEDEAWRGYKKEMDTPQGSMRMITMLVDGQWNKEFSVIEPGKSIEPNYDLRQVFRS